MHGRLALRDPNLLAECLSRDPDEHLALACTELAAGTEASGSVKEVSTVLRRFKRSVALLAGLGHDGPPALREVVRVDLVVGLFDDYADRFDEHLGELGYRAPELLFDAIQRLRPGEKFDILDMGCGTGHGAVVFRSATKSIVGIDIAPRMIEKSRERGTYNELICADLNAAMLTMKERFDLVISLDVFIYVGDMEEPVTSSFRALRRGGLIGFSVEKLEGAREGFILRPTQRYAHSPAYLHALAARAGFEEIYAADCDLRRDSTGMIAGQIIVWRKP